MAKTALDELMEIQAQKVALEDREHKLREQVKTELLAAAEKAVADLNNAGYHYRLVQTTTAAPAPRQSTGTRTRRSGVADEILSLIKASTGLTRGAIIAQLNAMDKAAQQSISNALMNLKKKGHIVANDGVYTAA